MGMSWKPILISLLCLGPGLVACGTGYHFSGVQAIADPSGVVHIVATVDMETEGGGGVYRAEVVSLYPDGVERSSLKLYRVADQALFVDATGALLLIRQHWPDPPLARLEGKRWRPFTLSDDLSEEATEWLDDIVVQGVGWTDEAGATRVYLPGEGLSGWIFDLADGEVTGATQLPASVEGAFYVARRTPTSLGAWLADAAEGCRRPCALGCSEDGCAWECDADLCLGEATSVGAWTAEGVPVTATAIRDATTGASSVTVSWPEGDVSVPIDVSTGERLQVQLVAGAGGGLLMAAYARLEPTVAFVTFDADFEWQKTLLETESGDAAPFGFAVAGTQEGDSEFGHVVFATDNVLTVWKVDVETGVQVRQDFKR